MSFSEQDKFHMKAALNLAGKGLGNVWPNPAVGCVLLSQQGKVIGRGFTQPSGRPHAETNALSSILNDEQPETAYVTLEPCSHFGKTPPCAQALISSKVKRVVVATSDPDPRVSGRGRKMLEDAGIKVEFGLCKKEADDVNAGFFSRITNNRPFISLKVATTLDGYIASSTGHSKWITGPQARLRGHLLRSQNDAILVGSGTALADDPSLTCRIEGASQKDQPVRIVLDRKLKLSPNCTLFATASIDAPVWVFHSSSSNPLMNRKGVLFLKVDEISDGAGLDLEKALQSIANEGITRLLIEGGGLVAASFLKSDLVDEIHWFRAPAIMGGDGVSVINQISVTDLVHMPRFEQRTSLMLGDDNLTIFSRS